MSVHSLLKQRDRLEQAVRDHKRAIRQHRAQLREAKAELTDALNTLKDLGFTVTEAKGDTHGRKSA